MPESLQNGTTMPNVVYGFIGLGNMGYGMAKNLRLSMPKNCKLLVCELNTERRNQFVSAFGKEGGGGGPIETAESPKEIAEKCDIIITSLPHGDAVKKVFIDPKTGLLSISQHSQSGTGNRKFFLETSTIEVRTSNEVLEHVQKSGLGDFIDCPVSGGIPAADQGNLTFMVGGTQELLDKAKPVLATMGKSENIIFCGPPGAGLATKQINNYIANVSYIALCEGMNTGIKYGLDPKVLTDVINVSSGMCWNSLHMNPVKGVQPNSSSSKDFEGGFKTELAKGVMDMTVQLMDDVGAKHVMGNVVTDVYARAVKHPRCADKECRSIYRLFSENEGKDLGNTKID